MFNLRFSDIFHDGKFHPFESFITLVFSRYTSKVGRSRGEKEDMDNMQSLPKPRS